MVSALLYNGRLVPEAEFALPLPNRGLFFNDGFFETMIWSAGGVRYLPDHFARLTRASQALALALPAELQTPANLQAALAPLAARHVTGAARIRLQVWRAGGGLFAPETPAADYLATARPHEPHDTTLSRADFVSVGLRKPYLPLSGFKGPHALHYVLAARERVARGLDELLLLNRAGNLTESVSAALFWIQDGCLFTPALGTGCIEGVRRVHLLRTARAQGVYCEEGFYRPQALLAAETVFTANVAAIRPLAEVAGQAFQTAHPLLTALRQWEAWA